MFSYGSVFELLISWLRNGVFNLLLGNLYQRENEVIPEVRKRRGGWQSFKVFVWRRHTSCWILSAMSPEIQEWSHKSRSRINNLYLLTRPINSFWTYVLDFSTLIAKIIILATWTIPETTADDSHAIGGGAIWWTLTRWRQAWCLLQVKLCDPCLSALKMFVYHARRYTSARLFCFTFNSGDRRRNSWRIRHNSVTRLSV